MAADIPWTLNPGDRIRRSELHDIYGGGRRGGMEPSATTPHVFLFTSKSAGAQFGYDFDGWHADGTFHYTGEGQVLDQVMTHGNKATRDHLADGRRLHLFEKDGTDVIYVGEFEVPDDDAHVLVDDAPDRNREMRTVFVFRLRPLGSTVSDLGPKAPVDEPLMARVVPVEAANVEKYVSQHPPLVETEESVRVEAALVRRYVKWLEVHRGMSAVAHVIPTRAGHLMRTDLFIVESQELVEAKASASREHLRSALGQVLDYARYVEHAALAVLTPTKPVDEMVSFLIEHGVGSTWETEDGSFKSQRPERFPA